MKLRQLQFLFLCLAVVVVSVGKSSKEVEDCEIRFEDSGVCTCGANNTAGPVTPNGDKSIKIKSCYCM